MMTLDQMKTVLAEARRSVERRQTALARHGQFGLPENQQVSLLRRLSLQLQAANDTVYTLAQTLPTEEQQPCTDAKTTTPTPSAH